MRRSHKLMAALALASGALVACDLLTGLDADYTANAHDGAVEPVGEGGGPDGPGSEGSTMDGMVPVEGGDGAVLSFCKAAQGDTADDDFFCADFENGGIATGNTPNDWTSQTNNVGGTISLVAEAGVNGSYALDVLSDTPDAAVYRQLRVTKQFMNTVASDAFKSYEVDLHFRLLDSTVNYDAFALLVFGGSMPQENGIAGYKAGPNHLISHEGPLDGGTVMTNDGQWHTAHVVLERTDAGTPFLRSISFNDGGTPIETKTPNHTFDPSVAPAFSIGSFNTATSAGLSHVQFDNIVVRRSHFQ
jgi:hypothetical protein